MKQWTDRRIQRHYRFNTEKGSKKDYLEISEDIEVEEELWIQLRDTSLLEEDLSTLALGKLNRNQAAKLGRLLLYFSENGILPVPRRQDPPKDEKKKIKSAGRIPKSTKET